MHDRILIVDNGSKYISQLASLCGPFLDRIVVPGGIRVTAAERYGLVILSGGYGHTIEDSGNYYFQEIQLLQRAKVPVVGICFGFQLMAYVYGIPLHRVLRKEHTFLKIEPTNFGKKVIGDGPFKVYENHRWVISKTPKDFRALAISKDGVEGIVHDSLPLVGLQFHPEMDGYDGDGTDMIERALSYVATRQV